MWPHYIMGFQSWGARKEVSMMAELVTWEYECDVVDGVARWWVERYAPTTPHPYVLEMDIGLGVVRMEYIPVVQTQTWAVVEVSLEITGDSPWLQQGRYPIATLHYRK